LAKNHQLPLVKIVLLGSKDLDFLPKGSISQKIRPRIGDLGDLHVFFVDFFVEVEKKKRWFLFIGRPWGTSRDETVKMISLNWRP